jgi:endonuclease G
MGAQESFGERTAPQTQPGRRANSTDYNFPFDTNYGSGGARAGFEEDYLGPNFKVQLPDLGPLQNEAVKLLKPANSSVKGTYVLDYRGYSLVMHAKRKFAIYTAANVDGGNRYRLRRQHDEWHFDPRIDRSAQIGAFYYSHNQFDRGHLTRYEDMEYGANVEAAARSATDTLHWTNCAPQHAKFNQGKQLWQGLEQHILEQSLESDQFKAIIFTGPVLDEGDPVWDRYKDIQYPLRFWKIGVALTSRNKLFAAAFVLDQSDVIKEYGIEATVEVPFSAFKTFQVPVEEIERLTGLSFMTGGSRPARLSTFDPLAPGKPARLKAARRPMITTEATGALQIPPAYIPLNEEYDIVAG